MRAESDLMSLAGGNAMLMNMVSCFKWIEYIRGLDVRALTKMLGFLFYITFNNSCSFIFIFSRPSYICRPIEYHVTTI